MDARKGDPKHLGLYSQLLGMDQTSCYIQPVAKNTGVSWEAMAKKKLRLDVDHSSPVAWRTSIRERFRAMFSTASETASRSTEIFMDEVSQSSPSAHEEHLRNRISEVSTELDLLTQALREIQNSDVTESIRLLNGADHYTNGKLSHAPGRLDMAVHANRTTMARVFVQVGRIFKSGDGNQIGLERNAESFADANEVLDEIMETIASHRVIADGIGNIMPLDSTVELQRCHIDALASDAAIATSDRVRIQPLEPSKPREKRA